MQMMSTVGGSSERRSEREQRQPRRERGLRWRARRAAADAVGGRRSVPNNRIGIQLYTMRRLMPTDDRQAVRRVLNWLGRTGYTEVEMAGYYGFTAGRSATGSTTPGCARCPATIRWTSPCPTGSGSPSTRRRSRTRTRWARSSRASRGSRARTTAEYFKFLADRFNKAGAMAAKAGLQFFYHNHDFEFTNKQADGSPVYDILLERDRPEPRQVRARPVLDHRRRREPARVPLARPRPVPRLPREGPDVEGPAERAGLRGRRPRSDRLPGHLRRGPGPRGSTSTSSSSTTSRCSRTRATRRRSTRPRRRA